VRVIDGKIRYIIYSVWLNAQNTTQPLLTDLFMNSLNNDTLLISNCDEVLPFPCSHACQPLLNMSL
jgi:hypothetical protein